MKKRKTIILIVIIFILMASIYNVSFAKNSVCYDFYITANEILTDESSKVLLLSTCDERTLINGKIAPRNFRFF